MKPAYILLMSLVLSACGGYEEPVIEREPLGDYLFTSELGIDVYGRDWDDCTEGWVDAWHEDIDAVILDFGQYAGFDMALLKDSLNGASLSVRNWPFIPEGFQDRKEYVGTMSGDRLDVGCTPRPANTRILVHEVTHLYLWKAYGDSDSDHTEGEGPWTEELEVTIFEWLMSRNEFWDYVNDHQGIPTWKR